MTSIRHLDIRPLMATALLAGLLLIAGQSLAQNANLQAAVDAYEAQDYATALKVFEPAAKSGEATAQYHLGMMNRFAWGVERNNAAALAWFEKAAEQSHPEAQSELAKMHKDGRGVERNPELAAQWFRRAAENGLGVAQLNLARMYRSGKGVPKDAKLAYVWFSLAIDNQYMDAIGHRARLARKMSPEDVEQAKAMTTKQREAIKK